MDGIIISLSESLLVGVAAVASSGCSEGLVGTCDCCCSPRSRGQRAFKITHVLTKNDAKVNFLTYTWQMTHN